MPPNLESCHSSPKGSLVIIKNKYLYKVKNPNNDKLKLMRNINRIKNQETKTNPEDVEMQ